MSSPRIISAPIGSFCPKNSFQIMFHAIIMNELTKQFIRSPYLACERKKSYLACERKKSQLYYELLRIPVQRQPNTSQSDLHLLEYSSEQHELKNHSRETTESKISPSIHCSERTNGNSNALNAFLITHNTRTNDQKAKKHINIQPVLSDQSQISFYFALNQPKHTNNHHSLLQTDFSPIKINQETGLTRIQSDLHPSIKIKNNKISQPADSIPKLKNNSGQQKYIHHFLPNTQNLIIGNDRYKASCNKRQRTQSCIQNFVKDINVKQYKQMNHNMIIEEKNNFEQNLMKKQQTNKKRIHNSQNQCLNSISQVKNVSPRSEYTNIFDQVYPIPQRTSNLKQHQYHFREQNSLNHIAQSNQNANPYIQCLKTNEKESINKLKAQFKDYSNIFLKDSSPNIVQNDILSKNQAPLNTIRIVKRQTKQKSIPDLSSDSSSEEDTLLQQSQPSSIKPTIVQFIKSKITDLFKENSQLIITQKQENQRQIKNNKIMTNQSNPISENKKYQQSKQSAITVINKPNLEEIHSEEIRSEESKPFIQFKQQRSVSVSQKEQKIKQMQSLVDKSIKIVSINLANVQKNKQKFESNQLSLQSDLNNNRDQRSDKNDSSSIQSNIEIKTNKIISLKPAASFINNNKPLFIQSIQLKKQKSSSQYDNSLLLNQKSSQQIQIIKKNSQKQIKNIFLDYNDLKCELSNAALSLRRLQSFSSNVMNNEDCFLNINLQKQIKLKEQQKQESEEKSSEESFDINLIKPEEQSSDEQILIRRVARPMQKLIPVREEEIQESVYKQRHLSSIKNTQQSVQQLQNQLCADIQDVHIDQELQNSFPTLNKQKSKQQYSMKEIVTDIDQLRQKIEFNLDQGSKKNNTKKIDSQNQKKSQNDSSCRSFHISQYLIENNSLKKYPSNKHSSDKHSNQALEIVNSKDIFEDMNKLKLKMINEMPKK